MRKGELKWETESLFCSAQEQVIRTNSVKYNINKTSKTPRYRLCNENVESVTHIISACPNLAKNQYQKRHDKVAKKIHWNEHEHVPDSVLENEGCKIWWPDIVCINKIAKSCLTRISL